MVWRKSPDSLKATFEEIFPPDPAAQRRLMFGYPAGFVNGNMFAGCHQENLILRLSDEDREAFLALPGASVFEPMKGRPMREYVVAPMPMLSDLETLRTWIGKAFGYAAALAPKKAKKAVKPKPKKETSRNKPFLDRRDRFLLPENRRRR